MSYEIKPLRGPIGLSTDLEPLVYETGLQVSEMALLNFVFVIDAVSAGIGALNPAVFVCEHSWDAGATWSAIPAMVLEDITAAGTFRAYASNATGLIAPNVRVYVSCPAGEELVIGKAQRIHVSPRDSAYLSPPSISGGVATEATLSSILADTTALVAKDFATEATLQKIRKWPYAVFATITPSEDATNTYYTYKTSGGTTVGTITINKTTEVITFSPDKDV